jgi:hypothetical protein
MGLLDRFRARSAPSLTAEFPGGVVQRTFREVDPVDKFYADMGSGLLAATVAAEAASPFVGTSSETAEVFIDPSIYRMMVSSEKMLERNGDILEGINAQIDLASGGITVSHKDPDVQSEYIEFYDRIDIDALIEDTWLTERIYGQAYPVSAIVDDQVSFFALNPKRVAVGRQLSVGGRPYAYFDPAVRKEFHSMGLWWEQSTWNEWPEFNPNASTGAIIIDPDRIYHRHGRKPSFKRYAIPKAIGAWEAFTDRLSLGELTRHTIDGLKTQIRVWRIDRPQGGEIAKLRSELASNDASRTYDLVWASSLQPVEHVIPGSIDELLANDTWMRMTKRLFFAMGMSMVLSGGETNHGDDSDLSVVVAVALSRLNADLRANCKLAMWCADQWISLERPDLAKAGPPSLGYIEPLISQEHALRGIAPLLNYGGVSIETALQKLGYDPEIEMQKLAREMPLRGEGKVIFPYPSFGQVGPYGQTTSQQSQGRPPGADMDPEHATQNSENARG